MTTLFITPTSIPADLTHFQSLPEALSAAQAGDTLILQSGFNTSTTGPSVGINKAITLQGEAGVVVPFSLQIVAGTTGVSLNSLTLNVASSGGIFVFGGGNHLNDVTVNTQVVLNGANGNTLGHVTANKLLVQGGSSGNTVSDSAFTQATLNGDTHNNVYMHNTFGRLTAQGNGVGGGGDSFAANTFNGPVVITGNASGGTGDAFSNNVFVVGAGDGLTLEHASASVIQHNTFTMTGNGRGVVVHNSDDVTVTANTVSGAAGTGVYVYADGTGSASVELTNNVLHLGSGMGLYVAKNAVGAAMEVRAQGNDFRGNAVGVSVHGDGVTAGIVDLGGETETPTRFDASIGENDFTGYAAADATHYAVGLFGVSPTAVMKARGNSWGNATPLSLVADGVNTVGAGGAGVISVATPPAVVEVVTASATGISGVQGGTTVGVVATFSSNLTHVAGDFGVMIAWGDGTSSAGTVVVNGAGGFDVVASHVWGAGGNFGYQVTVAAGAAGGVTGTAQGVAAISARALAATGVNFTIDKKNTFNGVVATFSDNLKGVDVSGYVAGVVWSDGVVTAGVVVKNLDGTFSVKSSRGFTAAGVVVGTVTVGTVDGTGSATAEVTGTVTNKNEKLPCGKGGEWGFDRRRMEAAVRHWFEEMRGRRGRR